ncbi:MAG TPA: penicillin-binding transpeptidase domain-containing protein [Bryobacteraceae bacterium]|jgi:hypothetical protein
MNERRLEAATVMQDVATGALVAFAASRPSALDVSTAVLPLSLSKVFLAASWWDNHAPESPVSVHEMLVTGGDNDGRQVALALRKTAGDAKVLGDLRRYGFNRSDEPFWAEVDPQWKKRLTPQAASIRVEGLNDADWATDFSIGEAHMTATPLHISRFLQAVGNNGLLCPPAARSRAKTAQPCAAPTRVVEEATAKRLMAAMIDTVKRGSAARNANALADLGWSMGGKTGTGGRAGAPMDEQDGWFAGLIFDPDGKARYTVATFVRRGGRGAGNAADICTQLARFVIP